MEQIEIVNSKHCIAVVPALTKLGAMSPQVTLVIGISGRAFHTASS
jgi:hypothetical protein